ncbi:ketosynthase chain-length factor [Nocardia terpenica]|uniref:Beta-ketoacyl synthase n=1 Tax=Nocardia terpenica TaxID=455432 RepID=A0A164LEB7_9NOCA|nr:ketosynthase chain-length factor [Nocardia terpenica]KZM72315.1 beta-ketoacyl synthase [Nocardia terpenica]NQE86801.1 ketosynthase chain-length factor [Nocardia terpenica]
MCSAVVTGIGAMVGDGTDIEAYWKAVLDGRSWIQPIRRYDASRYSARLAGQIVGFEVAKHLPSRLVPQTDRVTQLALVAADEALADARISDRGHDPLEMGVVTSNASGGWEYTHTEMNKLWTRGPAQVSVYESFAWFYAANTGQISIRNGMRGASGVLVADQAGGLDAIGQARRNLRRGAQLMVTGGLDSSLDPWGWLSHVSGGEVSTAEDALSAYLPFDATARGYVPGEGGAILVLERDDSACPPCKRYGRVAGYASAFDPSPGSGRAPNLTRALRLALADAGVEPARVDVVFADGAGVPERDRSEAQSIAEVFGPKGVPVTVPKAGVGRLLAGGGPLDVVVALLTIRDGVLPPTPNVRTVPDEYAIDLVLGRREMEVGVAVVLARGRGGFNSALVITK